MVVRDFLGLATSIPPWTVFLAIVIVMICIYVNMVYVNNFSRRHGQPGPLPFPLLGHFPYIVKNGMIQCHMMWVKKYGKVVGLSYGTTRSMIVADPELLREIMTKQSHHFVNREAMLTGTVLDHHLMNLKDERWRNVRSIMSPTFTSGKLRLVSQLVNQANETFLQNLSKYAENDQEFEAKELFSNFTIDVITATTCGIHVDSQTNPDDPTVHHFKKAMDFRDPFLLLIFIFRKQARWILGLAELIGRTTFISYVPYIERLVDQLIQERKEKQGSEEYKDFLKLLIDANKEFEEQQNTNPEGGTKISGMSKDEMTANIMLFFLAGFDTTSEVLQFMSYLLATHPEWQDKVIEELDDKLQGEKPNHDNVQTLNIMEMCYSEAMRMYPPGWVVDRIATDDVTINGTFISKNTRVLIPCWQIHHDPGNYSDPEEFKPERFTPEAKQARNPYTYLPFGMGPRSCIGMRLAQMELKMLFASVLQKYKFIPCERTQVPLVIDKGSPLRPTKGVWLKVIARE